MFQVELQQMTIECQRIKPLIVEWRNQYDEVGQVIRGLSGLTGMDHLIAGLRQEQGMIEYESRTLSQMMEALDTSIRLYESTENRIVGNVEGNQKVGRRAPVAPVNGRNSDSTCTDGIRPVMFGNE